MTIEFDMTLLDLDGVTAPDQVTRAEVDALVAYSTAVSLKRIADMLGDNVAAPLVTVGEPMVALKRGAAKAAVAETKADKQQPVERPRMPPDFRPWEGGDMPVDQRSDVVVWYRRGKSSKLLAAGSVQWKHAGGPDDVLGWRLVNDALDPESSAGASADRE